MSNKIITSKVENNNRGKGKKDRKLLPFKDRLTNQKEINFKTFCMKCVKNEQTCM